jgi:kynurenine formamidase
MMRNTPIDEFIVLTKRNGVGYGTYADIPWHVEKGYSPLDKLGITFPLKPQEASAEKDAEADPGDAVYVPTLNDQHRMMQNLHDQGLSYKAIAPKMADAGIHISWQKVRYHLQKNCSCVVTTEPNGSIKAGL